MKTVNRYLSLLGAIIITAAPLHLQGQLWPTAASEAAYGGPSGYAQSPEGGWGGPAAHQPAPYSHLWEGYCDEASCHAMWRMQNFMGNSRGGDCQQKGKVGSFTSRVSSPMCTPTYHHGRYVRPRTVCEDCTYSNVPQETYIEAEREVSPEPAAPEAPEADTSAAPRPIREPVQLSPVEAEQNSDDQVTSRRTNRRPVIQLVPTAPTPAEVQPRRIPRNTIPNSRN